MTAPRTPQPLARLLAVRMTLVAAASALGLLALFMVHYLHRPYEMSEQTLTDEAAGIAAALVDGHDPGRWPLYQGNPHAYAFRAFDKSRPAGERLLAEANAALLPAMPAAPRGQADAVLGLREQFEALPRADGMRASNGWMLTSGQTVQGRRIWVQAAMIGDPAWSLGRALGQEMIVHVAIPAGVLVPMMTLGIWVVMRRALRPLEQIAQQTRALGLAAARGTALAPLPENGLTRELGEVVRAVNVMLGELDRALARERAFAADAAHELRTPLAVLRLEVAELADGRMAKRLDEELAGLAHLVGQLLRFAQAEEVMASERRAVDVVEVARMTCEDLAPAALVREQELVFVAPEHTVMVSGNPTLLAIALRNLVENALRAAPSGGIVTVGITPQGLAVEDSGPGVPDAQKPHVFNRLWQADRRRDGAGIGLALVRRIAQLHDGAVWVEDRPGGGARFVLQLAPAAQATT